MAINIPLVALITIAILIAFFFVYRMKEGFRGVDRIGSTSEEWADGEGYDYGGNAGGVAYGGGGGW